MRFPILRLVLLVSLTTVLAACDRQNNAGAPPAQAVAPAAVAPAPAPVASAQAAVASAPAAPASAVDAVANAPVPGASAAVPVPASSVEILGSDPDPNRSMVPGQKVKLKVRVKYTMGAKSGKLGLIAQDASRKPLAQTLKTIYKGSGTTELTVRFTVPEAKAIVIFVPLGVPGQSATTTVARREFLVAAKK